MRINKYLLAAGLTAALAAPASAPAMATSAKNQATAKTQSAMPPDTKTFLKKAELTNLFEIQAGQLAQQKSDNSKVQAYAKMIVGDHQKAKEALKAAAEGLHIRGTIPTSLDKKHKKLIKQLQSVSGAKFLKTFKAQQVKGHKEGVKLFHDYGQAAMIPKLKQFAEETLPTLKKHLQQAQNLPTTASAPTVGAGGQMDSGMSK